jgi:hypothetical protein
MKKMKIFLLAAALALVTAGVFGREESLYTNYEIVAYNPISGYHQLIPTVGFPQRGLTLIPFGPQAKIVSSLWSGAIYSLFATNTNFTAYYPIYTTGF